MFDRRFHSQLVVGGGTVSEKVRIVRDHFWRGVLIVRVVRDVRRLMAQVWEVVVPVIELLHIDSIFTVELLRGRHPAVGFKGDGLVNTWKLFNSLISSIRRRRCLNPRVFD